MELLVEALPREMARVREVLGHYKEIGAPGASDAWMIEQTLRRADQAVTGGDLVEMMRAFQELQEVK